MRTLSAYFNNFEFISLQLNHSDSGFTQQASGVRTTHLRKKSIALKVPGLWSWGLNQSIPNGKGKDRAYQALSPVAHYLLSLLLQNSPLKTAVSGNQCKHQTSYSSALTSDSSVQCSWGLIIPSLLAPQLGAARGSLHPALSRRCHPWQPMLCAGWGRALQPNTAQWKDISAVIHIHISLKFGL